MIQRSRRNQDVGVKTCLPGFTLSNWCQMRSGKSCQFFLMCSPRSCIVPPEVSGASRSAKEVLFQGNVTYTCDTQYIICAFATLTKGSARSPACSTYLSLKRTSCVSPNLLVGPSLVHSASRSNIAVVYGQCVTFSCDLGCTINPRDVPSATSQLSCKENNFEPSTPESSSPVICNKPEIENVERSTVSVGCHQEVSRFLWISLDA